MESLNQDEKENNPEERVLNLDEIELLAEEKFKSGKPNVLDKWYEDSSFTEQCLMILTSPDVKFYSAFFAILTLVHHVDRFFSFWEAATRFEFSQTILDLVFSKEDLLNEQRLLSHYAKLAGSVIAEGWSNDPRFQDFLFEITKNEPKSIINNKICLNILEEVSESMRKLRVPSFGGFPLATIIDYSFKSISFFDGNAEIVNSSLKSIRSALYFYANGFDHKIDDPPKRNIQIDLDTQKLLVDFDFIVPIFMLSQEEPSLCFEILTLIISCDFKINHEMKKQILFCFIDNVCESCSLEIDTGALDHFFGLILRLKEEIDKSLDLCEYDYQNFMTAIYGKSLAVLKISSSFESNNSSIGDILSYYETLKEKNNSPLSLYEFYDSMKMNIITAFTQSVISLLAFEEPSETEILDLHKNENFHPWFKTINKIINPSAPEILGALITIFDSEDQLNNSQLAFMCNLFMSIIIDTNSTKIKQEYYQSYSESFEKVMVRLTTIFNNCAESPYLINSFLLFTRHFYNFDFLSKPSSFLYVLYQRLNESINIGSIEEMIQYILKILFSILQNCDQEGYILDSCKGLSYLFFQFKQLIFKSNANNEPLPVVKDIIELRVENSFPFLLDENLSRVRTAFHSSIATILVNKIASELCSCYLSIYDTALTEPTQSTAPVTGTIEESVWSYLCDFTGFFKFAKKQPDFQIFFSYILTHQHFEAISEHITNITSFSQGILIQFLKFWNALLDNDQRKIQFRHHSNNGINLFHCALSSIQSIVKASMPVMAPGADITRKTISYIFRIINSLLVADYVPYECFDYYGDTGLVDLLNLFKTCLDAAPPQVIQQYPKFEKILIRLTNSICSRHIEATAKPEVMCTEIVLDVINFGLCSNIPAVREIAIDCFLGYIKFNGIFVHVTDEEGHDTQLDLDEDPNAGFTAVVSKDKLILSASYLWNMFLTSNIAQIDSNSALIGYKIKMCIKDIFGRLPEMLDFVYSKMQEFLIQDEKSSENFEEAYQHFYHACSEMFQSGDTSDFEKEFDDFVKNALKCLRAPTKVFNVI